jgi:NADP-dependent 3-hydroxy acid dehydrogenase YdfG
MTVTRIVNETIWITGASSGIGRALAIRLAQQGNTVIASARSSEALNDLAAQQGNIIALPFDVTDVDSIERTRAAIERCTGHLNRIILNAGNCEYLDIDNPDWSMMQRVMDINYNGAINSLVVAMPLLKNTPQHRPHIIAVASLAAVVPFHRAEAYGASKAAIQYFFDALRLDLADKNVDVTVINPGFVKTPLTDKNDFQMPFLQALDTAAMRMAQAIAKRPPQYDFPRRLAWLLRVLGFCPHIWNQWVAPRLKN